VREGGGEGSEREKVKKEKGGREREGRKCEEHLFTSLNTHTDTDTDTHTRTHKYTHTHTHTPARPRPHQLYTKTPMPAWAIMVTCASITDALRLLYGPGLGFRVQGLGIRV
jgi:hypothetical protein